MMTILMIQYFPIPRPSSLNVIPILFPVEVQTPALTPECNFVAPTRMIQVIVSTTRSIV